jgi:hypothetical protein
LGKPPSIALLAHDTYSVHLFGGDLSVVPTPKVINYPFSDGTIRYGQWTDFMLMVKYAADNTGRIAVWRRDQAQSAFTKVLDVANVATLQYDSIKGFGPDAGHYWKQGLYRGASHGITNILWMGPMVRGTTFGAVEYAAFGTLSGMPLVNNG